MTEYVNKSHYSGLTLHRKCPQAWSYRYGLGLRRPKEGPATELHFGSWWGAVRNAEALERGRRLGSLLGEPRKFGVVEDVRFDMRTVTVNEVLGAAEVWWRGLTEEAVEQFLEKLGEPLLDRLVGSFERWEARWGEQTRYERPLAVELFWKRALPRPSGDGRWDEGAPDPALPLVEPMPTLELLGYIDELYEDTQRGIVVVRDNKTAKQLSPMGSALDDMMDSQLQLYAWGVSPWCHEQGVARPTATAYDRIRSVRPTNPQLTATTGKLSTATKVWDLHTYLAWVRTDTAGPKVAELLQARADQVERIEEYERQVADMAAHDEDPIVLERPEPLAEMTEAQLQAISDLPAGRLWGKLGEFFVSGANKGKPKFGVYQEDPAVVEHLTQPSWQSQFLQRTLVPLSRHVVTSHLRAAVDSATDIWRTQRRFEITREAARNLTASNCKYCDFQSLCRAQMVGGPDGTYDLREHKVVGPEGRLMLEEGQVVFGEVEARDSLVDA